MNKRFYFIAFIVSPIIAFYGVMPIYIFNKLAFSHIFQIFGGITIRVFIALLVLFFLTFRFPKWNNVMLFCVSISCTILMEFLFIVIGYIFHLQKPDFRGNEIAYPLLNSLAINVVLIVISKSILNTEQKANAERQLQEVKLQHNEAHIKMLMQQLQPHFLFNALSVLKSLIGENPSKAENYVVKLSEFLRYSIQTSEVELIGLEKELQFVKDYIELQKERFEEAFEYVIQIDEAYLNTKLPVMALQTLVENIFKHNYFTTKKPIHFYIKNEKDILIVGKIRKQR